MLNCILDSSGRPSEWTCMTLTPQCPYWTTAWKDEQGSATSQQWIISSCMKQRLILQPWLRRVIYPPFTNLDGMSGATIMNRPLPFLTIVKYLEESWALPEVKGTRWPNAFSRLLGGLCPVDHYNH